MTLRQKIFKYLDQVPVNDAQKNKYTHLMVAFGLTLKQASAYWLQYKALNAIPKANYTEAEVKKILKQDGDNLTVTVNNVDFEVKSLEDLLVACDIDTTKWKVESWQCRKWDVGAKETKQMFSVSAKFTAIKVEQDLQTQKDIILKELFEKSPIPASIEEDVFFDVNGTPIRNGLIFAADRLLELCLFDLHFGKLAHREEVGEDYDIKIASQRFMTAIKDLISNVDPNRINRILFPIGQDLINVDNLVSKTTAGTPQDCDSRFHKIVKTVKHVLVEAINMLLTIAPVDIVISVGNHDEQTTFMIGEMLDAYYNNNSRVKVFNDASLRKYYRYGVTSIMFTHGDKEKFQDLGMIFAAEKPELWAATKQRFIQIGHYHHNKKVSNVQAQEFQGFQVQILPSLSGSDAWHAGKGYNSLKQAKAFLYDKEKGLVGEFTHTAT